MTDIKDIYCFSDFKLVPGHRELTRNGEPVEIEPRAFELLLYLVKNSDRAVDKNELQDAIWPGMVVTETALTRAVMKARKAVGDDANRQVLIKTLHGHGYRFIGKLTNPDPTATDSSTPSQQPGETGKRGRYRNVALLGIAVVLLAALVWMFLVPQPLGKEGEIRIAVLPLQDNTGNQELAWSSLGLMSYADKLIAGDGVPVVPAGSIISLTENLGWNGQLEDPANEALFDRLQRIHGATHVLAMELENEGQALRMNYGLLDGNGKYHAGTMVSEEATGLAQGVVQAIHGVLFKRSRLGDDAPLVSEDPFNNEAFARGMDLSLQGRCNEAVQFFQVIIEQEPELVAPRFEYAHCLRIMGEPAEAETLLKALIEEQRPLGASRQLAQELMTLGVVYNRTGRLDLAQQSHEEALEIAGVTGDPVLRARILQNLSIVHKSRGEFNEAEKLLDLAVLAYREAGIESLPGHLYSGRANLKMARGELIEAEVELESALQAFRDVGDQRSEAMMLNNTGYLRRLQGRLEEAEAYHLRSLEIRQEIGDRVGVGRIYSMLSIVYSGQGKYQDAIGAAESALRIARETSDRTFEAASLAQLAEAERFMGERGLSRLHYLEGQAIFKEIQDTQRTLQSGLAIARLDLEEGYLERAESTALNALETAIEHDILEPEIEALELLGDLETTRGETGGAISHYTRGLNRLRGTSWASKQNELETKLANAYMDQSELQAAAPLIGSLAGGEPNVESLKAQARFAYLGNDANQAVELMSKAKTMAGENWADESEVTLQRYLGDQTP
ncbi:MAG: tetratricopeptide repeat protein [Xanthomonadales bacterium]|nr:tetratricopeptide repeat protein [Xanthomonadales bacterium]